MMRLARNFVNPIEKYPVYTQTPGVPLEDWHDEDVRKKILCLKFSFERLSVFGTVIYTRIFWGLPKVGRDFFGYCYLEQCLA